MDELMIIAASIQLAERVKAKKTEKRGEHTDDKNLLSLLQTLHNISNTYLLFSQQQIKN